MMCEETFQRWGGQKAELEQEYPYLLHPTCDLSKSCDLNKSQVFLSSINELHDK